MLIWCAKSNSIIEIVEHKTGNKVWTMCFFLQSFLSISFARILFLHTTHQRAARERERRIQRERESSIQNETQKMHVSIMDCSASSAFLLWTRTHQISLFVLNMRTKMHWQTSVMALGILLLAFSLLSRSLFRTHTQSQFALPNNVVPMHSCTVHCIKCNTDVHIDKIFDSSRYARKWQFTYDSPVSLVRCVGCACLLPFFRSFVNNSSDREDVENMFLWRQF